MSSQRGKMTKLRVVRRNGDIYIEDDDHAPVIVPVTNAEVKPHEVYDGLVQRGLMLPSRVDFLYVLMQVIYKGDDFEIVMS
ncbi:hypothetical protein KEJ51_03700 [Candidatus Bathyarchaeota archaeon]|nr:hypothetical protein [Candidatus Bathyarchaeota archaeon]MBS7629730.1 hypothetical protein [Candidatus Bathyarchaeota archaeon]